MNIALDLSKRHWTLKRSGLLFIGTWLKVADDQYRPCMAIIRANDEGHEDAVPCVITLDKCWIFSEEIGDPGQAARTVYGFAEALRIELTDRRKLRRLAGYITDLLGDLVAMPPAPGGFVDIAKIGDLIVRDMSGKVVSEIAIRNV